jgi:hypothetical protein
VVNVRSRLNRLEQRGVGTGCCPDCGHRSDTVHIVEVCEHGRGEPVAWCYEMDGRRHAYPPDQRPLCPTCGCRIGAILILTALYDGKGQKTAERTEL